MEKITKLIKQNPNDSDLGFNVRNEFRNDDSFNETLKQNPNDSDLGKKFRKYFQIRTSRYSRTYSFNN
jgi:hypothetical protein